MNTKPSWVRKKVLIVAAVIWTLAIAVLCLVDANELPKPDLDLNSPDKYVHFTFHFVFTILWVSYGLSQNLKNVFAKVFAASLVFGIVIEICQEFFTTTRSADATDVMANMAGAITAIVILKLLRKARVSDFR